MTKKLLRLATTGEEEEPAFLHDVHTNATYIYKHAQAAILLHKFYRINLQRLVESQWQNRRRTRNQALKSAEYSRHVAYIPSSDQGMDDT
jgi:hypothetical protein